MNTVEATSRKKILFGQIASNGDCLLVTPLVKQLKQENPSCHITWAIGSPYKKIIDGNPYVDEIWEIDVKSIEEIQPARELFEKKAMLKLEHGDYDEVIITDFTPKNYHNYFLTTRSFLFRSFGKKITVPVSPLLFLSEEEKLNVKRFADKNNLSKYKHVILIESAPKSGQSNMTPDKAKELSLKILERHADTAVILSSNIPFESVKSGLIDASLLSFRENAELIKYCSLLIGCSSGISWLMTSTASKIIPTIQIINRSYWLASMSVDHYFLRLPSDHIIEIDDSKIDEIISIIDKIIIDGFLKVRERYHKPVIIPINRVPNTLKLFLKTGRIKELLHFLKFVIHFYSLKSLIQEMAKAVQRRFFIAKS